MIDLKEKEEEITDLREQQGLTFKAIGERYHISPDKASRIYHRVQYNRREQRRQELRREENQQVVAFELTLGEAVILQRILYAFGTWKLRDGNYRIGKKHGAVQDADYIVSRELGRRLIALEKDTRQSDKVLL